MPRIVSPAFHRGLCAVLLLAACVSGCGGADVPRQSVLGRLGADPEETWQATVDALRTAGYHPASTDPTAGRLVVFSHVHPGVRYAVQLYREGWLQLQIEGRGLGQWNRVQRSRARVPSNVAREYESLAMSLLNEVVRPIDEAEDASAGGESDGADSEGADSEGADSDVDLEGEEP
ncbi:MAG: hypothetical protein AB8I08_02265 [Sandaracinaceae bacterium]